MSVVQDRKDINLKTTRDGRSLLHSACAGSNVDVVKRLLGEGAIVNVQSEDGATPLARVHPHPPPPVQTAESAVLLIGVVIWLM